MAEPLPKLSNADWRMVYCLIAPADPTMILMRRFAGQIDGLRRVDHIAAAAMYVIYWLVRILAVLLIISFASR